MDKVLDYLVRHHWGDIASVMGVVVSAVGFICTLIVVFRSRSAAIQAQAAAETTRDALTGFDTISKISAAIASMNEIKRLHRVNAWAILPDRYAAVRQELVLIRSSNPELNPDHRAALQGAIQQFSQLEQAVETTLSYENRNPPRAAKLNAIVSTQVDKLNEILDTLRQRIGSTDHA